MTEFPSDPGTTPDPLTPDAPRPDQDPDKAQPEIVLPDPGQPTIPTGPMPGEGDPVSEVPD